jgi:Mg2+ and Co2+ transporter CorA
MSRFVQEIDDKQANLQTTLEQAEKTTVAVSAAMEKLQTAAASVDTTAKDAAETARAWQSAAEVIGGVAREYYKKSESSDRTQSIDVKEWTAAAEQTSRTANDIKGLLSAMNDFSNAHDYGGVINAITLRAIGFVVLIFVLALMYGIISRRLTKVQSPKTATKSASQSGRRQ